MSANKLSNKAGASVKSKSRPPLWQLITLLVLAVVVYSNTFQHQYAQDDDIVIVKNKFTQQGLAGLDSIFGAETFYGYFLAKKDLVEGGRYRPLSLATFAIETALFGDDLERDRSGKILPGGDARKGKTITGKVTYDGTKLTLPIGNLKKARMAHITNAVLYGLVGVVICLWLFTLFAARPSFQRYANVLPFLAAFLFILHPLHTEAVANIKGRDELLAMLFSCLTMFLLLKAVAKYENLKAWLGYGGLGLLSFTCAVLSKENAYTFVAVFPLCLLFFSVNFKAVNKQQLQRAAMLFIGMALVFGLAFGKRQAIIAANQPEVATTTAPANDNRLLMNDPFADATGGEKSATIVFTFLRYYQLMVAPVNLTYDYYPYHISLQSWSSPLVLLSILIHIGLLAIGLLGLKKRTIWSFILIYYALTFSVVSNVFFPIGTFMSERLVFMPSLAFCLGLAYVLVKIPEWTKGVTYPWQTATGAGHLLGGLRQSAITLVILVVLVGFYGFKTVDRNKVWENNIHLFLTDVETSDGSAKGNFAAGGTYNDLAGATGNQAKKNAYYDKAKLYLKRTLEIHPSFSDAWLTLGNVYYYRNNNLDSAVYCYEQMTSEEGKMATNGLRNLRALGGMEMQKGADLNSSGNSSGSKNAYQNALRVFRRYQAFVPRDIDNLNDIGNVLASTGQGEAARAVLQEVLAIDADNITALNKLAQAYGRDRQQPNLPKSIEILERVLAIDPTNSEALENIGVAHALSGNLAQALPYMLQSEEVSPDDVQLLVNIGNVYRQLNNGDEAVTYFQKALNLQPTDINLMLNLGYLQIALANYDAALAVLKRAEQGGYKSREFYQRMSSLQSRLGNNAEAQRYAKLAGN